MQRGDQGSSPLSHSLSIGSIRLPAIQCHQFGSLLTFAFSQTQTHTETKYLVAHACAYMCVRVY